jgi:16S rRNA (cytidine1402-2'-O)-methyltransferase
VLWAHKNDIRVNPVSGPGSIYLALMASGFNGQAFTFHGYCPIKEEPLKKFISDCEKLAASGYTQIFIETPYRSDRILAQLLRELREETLLCIACGMHTENGFVATKSIAKWKREIPSLGKQPTVFLIGQAAF